MEALESLDSFQSSVELFVVALDEIRGSRTAGMEKLIGFHVRGQQIAVLEDVIQRRNLQLVIVMTRSTPTNVALQIRLTEERKIENLLFKIAHEHSVGLFATYFECSSDVFEEMHMAELDDTTGVHISGCHANGFIVIADENQQFVAGVLELGEKLDQGLVILRRCEHANRNVMREVIDAIEERNFPIVTLHGHELPVDDQEAAEAFGITVRECDFIVVRQMIKLCDNSLVGCIGSFADPRGE